MRRFILAAAALAGFLTAAAPADAEVRFGRNVRVGGHDFSHQTFNAKRRGLVYLYRGKPAAPGCRWTRRGDVRTKVCHLQAR